MKRILSIILVMALCLALVPVAQAKVGTGWNDECRGNKKAGSTSYGRHNWVLQSETPGKSCTSKGSAQYRCSYCGATATRATQAPGHKWGKWKITREATCTRRGQQTHQCKVCGKTETSEIEKKAHSWGEWVVTIEPTDFSMGTHTKTCEECGKEKTEQFYPDPTYQVGDKGEGVKGLQEKLNAAGYNCGTENGNFNSRTRDAVKALEAAHGFTADGIAWPGVQKWLGAADDTSVDDTDAASLELTVILSSAEQETYAIGDEVSFDWTLTNRGAEDLTLDHLYMACGGNTVSVCKAPMTLTANGGSMLMDTWTAELDAVWMDDGVWNLSFFGRGCVADGPDQGQYIESNSISFKLNAARKDQDVPLDPINSSLLTGNPAPSSPLTIGSETFSDDQPVFRSLKVVKQSKNDDDYYDGAKIPVQMRLTIDSFDSYKLMSISRSPGDSLETGDWVNGVLEAGHSYDFTYWMVLDPNQTGWKTRNVTVRLSSLTYNSSEEESCEVKPPFTLPTVRIEGGNDHMIDTPAFLYLYTLESKLSGYPSEGVDIPIMVETSAADEFSNVKLIIETNWMGKGYYSTTVPLAKKMKAHETVAFIPHWAIQAIPDTWKDYTVTMYVVGNTYDKNNKVQTIQSKPATLQLNVQDPDKQAGSLELTYSITPSTDPIWSKSKVQINFTIHNTGKEPVENVFVEYGEAYSDLKKVLGDIPEPKDGKLLEPDMTAHTSLTFSIPDQFIESKEFDITFTARGSLKKNGKAVRSKNLWIVRGVDSKIPKTVLSLSASLEGAKSAYPAGGKETCVLTLRNDSDKMLRKVRIYAVGDNRSEDRPAEAAWMDLGHGEKGWLWVQSTVNLKPGESTQFKAPVAIPSGFPGPGDYCPGWVADGELEDRQPVRSNPATVSMPVLTNGGDVASGSDMHLFATLKSNKSEAAGWYDGSLVRVGFNATYTGAETPSKIRVEAKPLQGGGAVDLATGSNVAQYIDELEFNLDAGYAIDDICYYTLTAFAYLPGQEEAAAVSEPFLLSFPMVEAEEDPQVDLNIMCSTPASEDGLWKDGDKVHVQFSADYLGEEVPVKLELCVYNAGHTYLADYSRSVNNSKTLTDGYDITLNADDAVDGKIVFSYVARAFLEDTSAPDHESKTIPLVCYMDAGDIETKINWDAVHASTDGTEDGKTDGTDETEPDSTDEAKPDDTDGTKPDGTDGTMPDGKDGTKPDGTEETKPDTDDTKPDATKETKPDGTDETKSDGKDVIQSDGTDVTKSDGTKETKPDEKDEGKPDGTDDTKPDVTDETKPEEKDEAKPDGTDDTKPDVTDETKPEEKDEGKPDGTDETKSEQPVEKYKETVVTIPGDGHDIPATVCLPSGDGLFSAVVMLHGTGSTRDEAGDGYKYAAPVLAQKYGIATIRIDFPGNGDSTADYMLYNFHSAVSDAKAAADYMASLDCINGNAIGVMGWSQGGTDALLVCAWEPETFRSVVTWAGAPDMMLDGFFTQEDYQEAKEKGYFVMEFDWRDSLNVSLAWCEDVVNTDVLDEFAKGYSGPVLAIAGTDDDTVDPVWSEKIVAASSNEHSATYFIKGMDHTFNVFSEEDLHSLYEAIDATGTFFAETLR